MDQFSPPDLPKRLKKATEQILSEIVSCPTCESHDGEVLWLRGDAWSVSDLLDHFGVEEKDWEIVIPHLQCSCGQGDFDEGDEIGVKPEYEKEIEAHVDQAFKTYGKGLRNFNELLINYPMLAATTTFGKKIINEIKNKSLPSISISGDFYRARKATTSSVLTITDMLSPPIGIPTEGRFNHAGQSHLYLSGDEDTAMEEVTGSISGIVWTAKLSIEEPIDKILDLTFDDQFMSPTTSLMLIALHNGSSLVRNDKNVDLWRPDYFITRYMMDIAKQQGYNGIKYNSAHNRYVSNVVIFYPEKCELKSTDDPKISKFDAPTVISVSLPTDDMPM